MTNVRIEKGNIITDPTDAKKVINNFMPKYLKVLGEINIFLERENLQK